MLQRSTQQEVFTNYPGDQLALYTTSPETQAFGYTLRSVEVPDISEHSETFAETHEALSQLNDLLEQNPNWEAPMISEDGQELILDPDNIATNALYVGENVESARHWRLNLVPSALALEALALKSDYLPTTDVKIDEATRDIFTNSADARAIRSRGALMRELIAEHSADKNPITEQKWISLACGAARPVLEAAERVKRNGNTPIDVTLVDYDPVVLNYSSDLADSIDGAASHREIESDLRRTMIAKDTLVQEFGEESMDMVDIMGFLEYCPDKAAVNMLRNSYRLTAPGGMLLTANMREDRPEKQIHLRGIGWPGVQMRSHEELVELAVRADIDPTCIEAYQPTDGVYTILKIVKPIS